MENKRKVLKKIIGIILNTIWSVFWNRYLLALLIVISTFLLFEPLCTESINNVLVIPIFSRFDDSLRSTIIFGVISIALLGLFIYLLLKSYVPSSKLSIIIITSGCIITYYRYTNIWTYYSVHLFNEIKYLDLFILITVLTILLVVTNTFREVYFDIRNLQSKNTTQNKSLFFINEKWSSTSIDLLERNRAANRLAEEIKKIKSENSFAIGIIGEWGTGKSVFLEIIKQNLEKNNNIVIVEFNPWKSSTSDLIIRDFLNSLAISLSKLNGDLLKEIEEYSRLLSKYDSTSISEKLLDFITTTNSIDNQYSVISNLILKLKKKIVVIIDDLDRLDKEEIVQVLKLIRNTADFSNTVFIAAYDRKYIDSAIHKMNEHHSNLYLEKIFQMELALPIGKDSFVKDHLRSLLLNELPNSQLLINNVFSDEKRTSVIMDYFYDGWDVPNGNGVIEDPAIALPLINQYIATIRDIHRLTSSFNFNYSQIEGEIEFEDYLCLEIIKLKELDVYEAIKKKLIVNLRTQNDQMFGELIYVLNEEVYDAMFPKKNSLKGCLKHLFPLEYTRAPRTVQNNLSFSVYFSNALFNNISLVQLKNARKEGYPEMKKFIDSCIEDELTLELVTTFEEINFNNEPSDIITVAKSKLYLLGLGYYRKYNELMFEYSSDNLSLLKRIDTEFESNIEQTIITTIKESSSIHISNWLRYVIDHYIKHQAGFSFIMSKEECQEKAVGLFTQHIREVGIISDITYQWYYNCLDYIDENNKIHLLNVANREFHKYAIQSPEAYLATVLFIDPYGNRFIRPFIDDIFGSHEIFETFLSKHNSYSFSHDLNVAYEKFKRNGYQNSPY